MTCRGAGVMRGLAKAEEMSGLRGAGAEPGSSNITAMLGVHQGWHFEWGDRQTDPSQNQQWQFQPTQEISQCCFVGYNNPSREQRGWLTELFGLQRGKLSPEL